MILALSIQLADCCYLILLLALLCASASYSPSLSYLFVHLLNFWEHRKQLYKASCNIMYSIRSTCKTSAYSTLRLRGEQEHCYRNVPFPLLGYSSPVSQAGSYKATK